MRSNCVFYALKQMKRGGGYLIIRKSRFGWMPHVMWAESIAGLKVQEYKPISPFCGNRLQRMFPVHMFRFHGRERKGVGEEVPKELRSHTTHQPHAAWHSAATFPVHCRSLAHPRHQASLKPF